MAPRLDPGAFVEAAADLGLVYGVNDCLMMPANWILAARGVDPATPWRGRYDCPAGAARLIIEAGGQQALMAAGCEAAGCAPADPAAPPVGAVGMVWGPVADTLALMGAVRLASGWAVLSDQGITVAKFATVAAWEVL